MTEEEYKNKIKQALVLLQECQTADIDFDEDVAIMGAVLVALKSDQNPVIPSNHLDAFPDNPTQPEARIVDGLLTIMDGLNHV